MILLKKFKKLIPSYRHKKDINIFDNVGGSFRTYNIKKTNTNLQHLRYKKKVTRQFNTHINIVISQHLNLIVEHYSYEYHPYRKFLVCKTLDNTLHYLPGIEYINVGSCIYSHTNKSLFNITNLLRGFVSEVRKLPINTLVSNLNNYTNSKNTFAKSSGTYCKLKKNKKTKKNLHYSSYHLAKRFYSHRLLFVLLGKIKISKKKLLWKVAEGLVILNLKFVESEGLLWTQLTIQTEVVQKQFNQNEVLEIGSQKKKNKWQNLRENF